MYDSKWGGDLKMILQIQQQFPSQSCPQEGKIRTEFI